MIYKDRSDQEFRLWKKHNNLWGVDSGFKTGK